MARRASAAAPPEIATVRARKVVKTKTPPTLTVASVPVREVVDPQASAPPTLVSAPARDVVNPQASREFREQVEREVFGRKHDSFNIDTLAKLAAAISSSQYAQAHMQKARRCRGGMDILSFCIEQVSVKGLYLEFGVFSGKSINHTATCAPDQTFYGFDSFQGLPETWRPGFKKGAFSLESLPPVRENVELVPGWFDRSLPVFCDAHPDDRVAFLHVDCDLYSSTQTIFAHLRSRIVPGTIIAFNEYFNYAGWEQHEIKAFAEYCSSYNVRYEYIALVAHHQQVAVRILATEA